MTNSLPIPIAVPPAAVNLIGLRAGHWKIQRPTDIEPGIKLDPSAEDSEAADFLTLLAAVVQSAALEPPELPTRSDAAWPGLLSAQSSVDSTEPSPRFGSTTTQNNQNVNATGQLPPTSMVRLPASFSLRTVGWSPAVPRVLSALHRPTDPLVAPTDNTDLGHSDLFSLVDTDSPLGRSADQTPFSAMALPHQQLGAPQQASGFSGEVAPTPLESSALDSSRQPPPSSVIDRSLIVTAAGKEHIEVALQTPQIGPVWLQVREGSHGIEARLETHTNATMEILQVALDGIRERVEAGGVELGSLSLGFRHDGTGSEHPRWMAQPHEPVRSNHGKTGHATESVHSRIQSVWRGQINVLA